MTGAMHGVVHGKTIELFEALGVPDGQVVEVTVRNVVQTPAQRTGEGLLRTEGALADDTEWDAIMEELHQAR